MNRWVSIALVLLAVPMLADENPPQHAHRGAALHYLITTDHVLAPGELAAEGVEVQHALPGNRYLVRATDAAARDEARGVLKAELYAAREKLSAEGLRAAASRSPFVTVNVLFHDDVTFDDALAAVDAAGGTIETPLAIAAVNPQRLQVRIPPALIAKLARDEAVFGIYGRPLRPAPVNDKAAALSHVTAVYSAPYNLDGTGIVLSQFEPDDGSGSGVDTTHPEFNGRVTTHNTSQVGRHATHVAGTMIAKGINGRPDLDANGRHYHVADSDGSVLTNEVFCYSQNGTGTDCPAPPTCSAGNSTKSTEDDGSVAPHCEVVKHPTYGPYNTLSFIGAEKNVLAVGACGSLGELALFSSRGPAKDGRVKPELIAIGPL